MSRKYKFHKPDAAYFISFATVEWVDLFTREIYFGILADSIQYCRKNKGLELFAYCFMPNHVHMLFRSTLGNPSGLIRDIKSYTSKQLINAIKENPRESRKEYLLAMFKKAAIEKSNGKDYQLWRHDNQPIEVFSSRFIKQKVNYIHMNPVNEGLVTCAVYWKYSSARNYAGDQTVLEIDLMDSIEGWLLVEWHERDARANWGFVSITNLGENTIAVRLSFIKFYSIFFNNLRI